MNDDTATRAGSLGNLGRLGWKARIVGTVLGVPGQGVAVAADAECGRRPGDHDGAHRRCRLEHRHRLTELGVHVPRPGIVTVGAVEEHRRRVSVVFDADRLQVERLFIGHRPTRLAESARPTPVGR